MSGNAAQGTRVNGAAAAAIGGPATDANLDGKVIAHWVGEALTDELFQEGTKLLKSEV